jgi:glyceraldehyde-3-phosphate dehydrogenase (NADP+)
MIEMDIDVCYNMNIIVHLIHLCILPFQGCVFTKDINKAIMISDAMETGTVQINSAPARGPDHFPFQVLLPCH